jgi:predicted RNA-binding Zn-ribbon protein involved in translation (DUF1610 family)
MRRSTLCPGCSEQSSAKHDKQRPISCSSCGQEVDSRQASACPNCGHVLGSSQQAKTVLTWAAILAVVMILALSNWFLDLVVLVLLGLFLIHRKMSQERGARACPPPGRQKEKDIVRPDTEATFTKLEPAAPGAQTQGAESAIPERSCAKKGGLSVPYVMGQGQFLSVLEDKVVITPLRTVTGFVTRGLTGQKTIPFASISAIDHKRCGVANGYLQFIIPGGIDRAPFHDPNTFI